MKTRAELADEIQKVIDEFVADPEPFWVSPDVSPAIKTNLREIAGQLNVLPVTFDWFESWGIQPDGEILFFQFEKPYIVRIETNQKIINMVFFDAAKKYSQFAELMPVRNPESIICPGCDGTGISKQFADHEFLAKSVRCICGGVGWLPSADPKYLYF
jgi:hypothetical protein